MSKNISCLVCGGKDFTVEAGSYFCLECNTQSQEIREEVFDEYVGTQKVSSRVLQKSKPKSVDSNERLTSWEVLNYLLKGLTDQLIALGASADLKLVTLQLWAGYLRRLEVAFTSVDVERKPRLGYVFRPSDAEIVYGVSRKQLRARSWRSRASTRSSDGDLTEADGSDTEAGGTSGDDPEASHRSAQRRLANRKRALASAEYSQMAQELSKSMSQSQTLEDLDSSTDTQNTPRRLKVTRYTRSLLSSLVSSTDDEERSAKKKIAQKERKSLRTVTAAKVAAVSCVALALTRQDILISDFIRWVEEGHLSLGSGWKFLPASVRTEGATRRLLEVNTLSHSKLANLMRALCDDLEIGELPPPDRTRLAQRYCEELRLPGEIENMSKRLVQLGSTQSRSNTPRLVEMQTMAAVLVTLKLLLSLDDVTELKLSETASKLNRASVEQGSPTNLFVWSDWVEFCECRRAVVAGATRSRPFSRHQRPDEEQARAEAKPKYALNKDFVSTLTQCLQRLSEESERGEEVGVEFPASLTPLHTATQTLLRDHPRLVGPATSILRRDFTSTSAKYLIQPEVYVTLGLSLDLTIYLRTMPPAIFTLAPPPTKEAPAVPKVGINRTSINVRLVKRPEREPTEAKVKTGSPLKRLMEEIDELISNDSDDETETKGKTLGFAENPTCDKTVLELYEAGSQYWFLHCPLQSTEEFEHFAMSSFPSSFLWLLRECARVIRVPIRDLYAEVITIEKSHKQLIKAGGKGNVRRKLI